MSMGADEVRSCHAQLMAEAAGTPIHIDPEGARFVPEDDLAPVVEAIIAERSEGGAR